MDKLNFTQLQSIDDNHSQASFVSKSSVKVPSKVKYGKLEEARRDSTTLVSAATPY